MRRYVTGCKLLLAAPVFVLLMQLALSLHHHRSHSFHDDEDSLHSFTSAFYPDHMKLDLLGHLSVAVPKLHAFLSRINALDFQCLLSVNPIVESSHSRAPPTSSIS